MNQTTLLKFSLVCLSTAVAVGASLPQKAYARETGTVPIIKAPVYSALARTKDNGTVPIILNASATSVTAPTSGSGSTITVTVTVNTAPTTDTSISLSTNSPSAVGLPSSVVVPAGSTTATATVTILPGQNLPTKSAQFTATANGVSSSTTVLIAYQQGG